MIDVFIALGSNLDNPVQQLRLARQKLRQYLQEISASSLYLSAAVGYTNQADFVNAVIHYKSNIPAPNLLNLLLKLEAEQGRVRSFANAPRTLDLDLLIYGEEIINLPQLTIPHLRMVERSFVIFPLIEIAPDLIIPSLGKSALEISASLEKIALNPEQW